MKSKTTDWSKFDMSTITFDAGKVLFLNGYQPFAKRIMEHDVYQVDGQNVSDDDFFEIWKIAWENNLPIIEFEYNKFLNPYNSDPRIDWYWIKGKDKFLDAWNARPTSVENLELPYEQNCEHTDLADSPLETVLP